MVLRFRNRDTRTYAFYVFRRTKPPVEREIRSSERTKRVRVRFSRETWCVRRSVRFDWALQKLRSAARKRHRRAWGWNAGVRSPTVHLPFTGNPVSPPRTFLCTSLHTLSLHTTAPLSATAPASAISPEAQCVNVPLAGKNLRRRALHLSRRSFVTVPLFGRPTQFPSADAVFIGNVVCTVKRGMHRRTSYVLRTTRRLNGHVLRTTRRSNGRFSGNTVSGFPPLRLHSLARHRTSTMSSTAPVHVVHPATVSSITVGTLHEYDGFLGSNARGRPRPRSGRSGGDISPLSRRSGRASQRQSDPRHSS